MRRMLRLSCFACALASAATAHAEVELVPASDGHLGTWLVSGPVAGAGDATKPVRIAKDASPAAGFPAWRLVSTRDGAIDLGKTFGLERKGGAWAWLGGELVTSSASDGWLLLSSDGPVAVYVDETLRFRRDALRLRDGSWDAIPIALEKGRHRLLVVSQHPGNWWAFDARWLDAKDLLPPANAVLALPGTTDADRDALLERLMSVTLDPGLGADGYRPRLGIEYRRGAPRGGSKVTLTSGDKTFRAGSLPLGPRGVAPFEVLLPSVSEPKTPKIEVKGNVDKAKLATEAAVSAEAIALFARAHKARSALPERDRETLLATLEWRTRALADARGPNDLRSRTQDLKKLLDALDAKSDVLRASGMVHVARRSPVDAEPDPILIQVPDRFQKDPNARFPLIVALHGLNGSEQGIMDAFLDSTRVDGFVIAPYAHGNAFYRGPGEREVMAAVDWALEKYPIDRDRVAMTGVSMGGTGTAHIGLRYADRFSAAAPLCGYHSFFVRRDTSQRAIRPWEREQMQHYSPTSIAERGRSLPMWVAHGTKDFPLENSRVFVDRYKQLKYTMTDEWPDTGHDVWKKAYAGARLFSFLSRAKRPSAPPRVTLKSDQLRLGQLYWVKLTALSSPGQMAVVDAEAKSATSVVVKTESAGAFELARTGPIGKDAVEAEIDGQKLSFAAGEPIQLVKRDGKWQKGKVASTGKRAGVEGPIRDAFMEPLVFVYGSLDERTRRANREVAEAFARTRHGPGVAYRVLSDRELSPGIERDHGLFLVGNTSDHALLRELSLPIRAADKAIVFGERKHDAPGVGAIFIHPNPRHPDRYLVVITAPTAAGIWRALSLPQMLPDFLVYDDALAPAAGEVVLGNDAKVVAGGFFDQSWKLPSDPRDPEVKR
jgi:predicted esterase